MDFKKFFSNKLNMITAILLALSLILLVIGSFVPAVIGVSVVLFGVTCGFAIPVAFYLYKNNDNSKAMENIELTPTQAKKFNRQQTSKKWNFYLVIAMLAIFCVALIYSGIVLYL